MADQTTVPAVRPEGRFAKRVFLVLAIASAAAFALAFLYALSMRSATGHWLPIEIRSPGLLSAVYTSMGFSPALFFLSAMIRVLLPRGKRWYQWVAFAVLQLALHAALVFAVGTVFDIARGRTYYEETQGTMIFGLPGPRADSRILYVARGRPRMKVAQQDDGRFRLIRDTSLPIRYSVSADINTLSGRWEVRDGAVVPELDGVRLNRISVVQRYADGARHTVNGLFKGVSIDRGAVATSWPAPSAYFVVVGSDSTEMCANLRELDRLVGGCVVTEDGEVRAVLPLDFYGVMADMDLAELVEATRSIDDALAKLGHHNEGEPVVNKLLTLFISLDRFGFMK